jgi:hypothetical protein
MRSKNFKYLVINHTRKTYHYSNSGYCYRENDKNGREVTEPNEKFIVCCGILTVSKQKIPKGYKNDMK